MTLLKRLRCALLGRRWTVGPDDHPSDVGAERNCECEAHVPAIVWPQGAGYQPLTEEWADMPKPARPAPPKPYESIEREIASLRARVARLERGDRG